MKLIKRMLDAGREMAEPRLGVDAGSGEFFDRLGIGSGVWGLGCGWRAG